MRKVGFIGLGIMGKPMVRNLLKAGIAVTVYEINAAAVEEMTKAGADPKKVFEATSGGLALSNHVELENFGAHYGRPQRHCPIL